MNRLLSVALICFALAFALALLLGCKTHPTQRYAPPFWAPRDLWTA